MSITIRYVTWTSGHRRHHSGGLVDIPGYSSGSMNVGPGDSFPVIAPPTLPVNGSPVPFAFMCVHGAADGNHLYTTPGSYPINVGTDNLNVVAVYIDLTGTGGDGFGVLVDAFNVDTGDFSDSDFIEVYDTPGSLNAAATAIANNDGWVSSNRAETLKAYTSVDGVPFVYWEKISDPNVITNVVDCALVKNDTGVLFAFYKTPQKSFPDKQHLKEWSKELPKEYLKESFKDTHKEIFIDKVKDAKDFHDGGLKQVPEIPGPGPVIDPELIRQVLQKINELERKVEKVSTFIKPVQRPVVGKEIMGKAKKTRKSK